MANEAMKMPGDPGAPDRLRAAERGSARLTVADTATERIGGRLSQVQGSVTRHPAIAP